MTANPSPDKFAYIYDKDRQKLEEQIRSPKSPYLPGFNVSNEALIPSGIENITSATFVADQWVFLQKQHPLVEILGLVSSGVGTSGEWQFVHNSSSTVLASGTINTNVYEFVNFTVDVTTLGSWNNTEQYRFDVKRNAGANSLGIVVLHSLGKTSAFSTS